MTDQRPYMNHTITITADWKFEVEGEQFDSTRYKMTFQSLEAAKEEIKKRVDDANKLAASGIKIDLKVLDEDANIVVITKINRQSGDVIGAKGRYMYPDTQFVRNLILQTKRLRQSLAESQDKLEIFRISTSRGYGRISAEDYIATVKQLQTDYDHAMEKAKAAADPAPPTLSVVNERSE